MPKRTSPWGDRPYVWAIARSQFPDQMDPALWESIQRAGHDSDVDAISEGFYERARFDIERGSKLGDMLWTTGPAKLVSDRFADCLEGIGAAGYSLFDIDLRGGETPVAGYRGLRTWLTGGPYDIWGPGYLQAWTLFVSDRVYDALLAAGVDDFETDDQVAI